MWQDMTTPAMKASVYQPDCSLLSFPMDIMISDNEETRFVISLVTRSLTAGRKGKILAKEISPLHSRIFFVKVGVVTAVGPNRHALNLKRLP